MPVAKTAVGKTPAVETPKAAPPVPVAAAAKPPDRKQPAADADRFRDVDLTPPVAPVVPVVPVAVAPPAAEPSPIALLPPRPSVRLTLETPAHEKQQAADAERFRDSTWRRGLRRSPRHPSRRRLPGCRPPKRQSPRRRFRSVLARSGRIRNRWLPKEHASAASNETRRSRRSFPLRSRRRSRHRCPTSGSRRHRILFWAPVPPRAPVATTSVKTPAVDTPKPVPSAPIVAAEKPGDSNQLIAEGSASAAASNETRRLRRSFLHLRSPRLRHRCPSGSRRRRILFWAPVPPRAPVAATPVKAPAAGTPAVETPKPAPPVQVVAAEKPAEKKQPAADVKRFRDSTWRRRSRRSPGLPSARRRRRGRRPSKRRSLCRRFKSSPQRSRRKETARRRRRALPRFDPRRHCAGRRDSRRRDAGCADAVRRNTEKACTALR